MVFPVFPAGRAIVRAGGSSVSVISHFRVIYPRPCKYFVWPMPRSRDLVSIAPVATMGRKCRSSSLWCRCYVISCRRVCVCSLFVGYNERDCSWMSEIGWVRREANIVFLYMGWKRICHIRIIRFDSECVQVKWIARVLIRLFRCCCFINECLCKWC